MKTFYRIIAVVAMACLVFSNAGVTAKAQDKSADNEYIASAIFGSKLILSGISDAKMGTSQAITVETYSDRDGWLLDSSKGTTSSYIGIDLDSSLVSGNEDGSQYEVEVDYFDTDNLVFGLVYDAIDKSDKETDLVYGGTEKEWKTHTFVLDDACFSDRLDNFDLKIAIRTKKISAAYGNVTIGAVRIKRHTAKNPVQVISAVSGELGNIFANGEAKSFHVSFRSYSQKQENVTVTYKAIDESSTVRWQTSESLAISSKSEAETTVEIDVSKYSLYHLVIEVSGEGFCHTKSVPFSFVNSTEDGSRNDDFGFNVHFQNTGYSAVDGVEVIKKSNAGYVRNTPEWAKFDTDQGLIFPDYFSDMANAYKNAGLKLQVLFAYGNTKYGAATVKALPETDEQIQAYANYCAFVATELENRGIDVCSYEIWNEPNLTKFGGDNTSPELYLEVAKSAATALREADPDAKIGALAVANALTDDAINNWYTKYLDADPNEYFDAVTIHPYEFTSIPEDKLFAGIKEYKKLYEEKYADSSDAKPFSVYITEHGYRVNEGVTLTEQAQADNVTRAYILLKANHVNDFYTMYEFSNVGGVESNISQTLGAVQSCKPEEAEVPYAAKSVFLAVANMNKQLQNAECTQTLLETGSDYAYVFKRPEDDKNIIALWTTEDPKPITLSLDTDEAVLYDAYGNAQVIKGNNGTFTFTASNSVSYVEGFTEASLAEPVITAECYDYTVAATDEIDIKFNNTSGNVYNIEVEAPDNVTLISVPEQIGNSGVVTVKVPSTADTDATVRVRFEQDDETVQCIDIHIHTIERMAVSIDVDPADEDSLNWICAVRIKNFSNSDPLSGYFSILSPQEIADKIEKIEIPAIPAGSAGIVRFEFPKSGQRSMMYKLKCRVEADTGEVYEFYYDVNFTVALYAEEPPVIDGELKGEWDEKSAITLENADQVHMGAGFTYHGVQDLSARTYIMYDEDNLYLFSKVQDDVYCMTASGSNIWKNDSIQFGLFFDQEKHDVNGGSDFSLFALSDTPEGPVAWRHRSENSELSASEAESAELAIRRDGNFTYYELKLPWSEVKLSKPDFNVVDKIGFSMLINDNDGNGRKGWIAYADGIGLTKDTSLFSFLNIIPAFPEQGVNAYATEELSGGIKNEKLAYAGWYKSGSELKTSVKTEDEFLHTISYVNTEGTPIDWLFNSITFLNHGYDDQGKYTLYHNDVNESSQYTGKAGWESYLDYIFDYSGETDNVYNLDALDAAVASAKETLNDPDYTVGVKIPIMPPVHVQSDWGLLTDKAEEALPVSDGEPLADEAEETVLFETDFESDTPGSSPTSIVCTGTKNVDSIVCAADSSNNTQYLNFNKRLRGEFVQDAKNSGILYIDFDAMATTGYLSVGLLYSDSMDTYGKWIFGMPAVGGNEFLTWQTFNGIPPTKPTATFKEKETNEIIPFSANTWNSYCLKVDIDNSTVTLSVNGVESETITDYKYFDSNTLIGGVAFRDDTSLSEAYIDNIKIYWKETEAIPPVEEESLDFTVEGAGSEEAALANRLAAVNWYINEVISRFEEKGYENITLDGFCYDDEAIRLSADPIAGQTIRGITDEVHDNSLKIYWIPHYQAECLRKWSSWGFDYAIIQPNYAFNSDASSTRIADCAALAKKYGLGIEMELGCLVDDENNRFSKFKEYLTQGVDDDLGYQNHSLISWYTGTQDLYNASNNVGGARYIYDAIYQFLQGYPVVFEEDEGPDIPEEPNENDNESAGDEDKNKIVPVTEGDKTTCTVKPENYGSDTFNKVIVSKTDINKAVAQASAAAKKSGTKAVVEIQIESTEQTRQAQATIPVASLNKIVKNDISGLVVSSGIASILFDTDALRGISGQTAEDSIRIVAGKIDASSLPQSVIDTIGNAEVFEFSIFAGTAGISSFNGGKASVTIPYTLKKGESADGITVWYIGSDGTLQKVENAEYNKDNKTVTFETTHFSTYAISFTSSVSSPSGVSSDNSGGQTEQIPDTGDSRSALPVMLTIIMNCIFFVILNKKHSAKE